MKLVIFQTLAANIGCALTPMCSPQNLFIFSYYNLKAFEFLEIMLPFLILGAIWLFILNLTQKNRKLDFNLDKVVIENKQTLLIFFALFLFILLSVFNIIIYISF
ncbi:hypothetical protein [Clostridium sp. FP1]|uniref:hypothetical protein n=1 Tax=Clostridium sp. FP1 TaxID=2724076 RepID=UPI00398CC3B1